MRYPQPKCCYCGRFVQWDSDASSPFGSAYDTEPPDPEHYCRACAKRLEEEAVTKGRLPLNWVRSAWERRAAKRIGAVKAGPKGAAWGHWYAPDRLPEGYVIHEVTA